MVRCYICNVNGRRFRAIVDEHEPRKRDISILFRQRYQLPDLEINENSRICLNCFQRVERCIELSDNPLAIPMDVLAGNRGCFVCTNDIRTRLSLGARVDFFAKTNIFIPSHTPCCVNHLNSKGNVEIQYMNNNISLPMNVLMTGREIHEWFLALKDYNSTSFDSEEHFEDEEFKKITSINKQQFADLFSTCQPVVIYGKNRVPTKKDMIAFLMKLRQGLSDEYIKVIMSYTSRQAVSLAITIARSTLMQTFVPNNLGFHCHELRNRGQFIERHVTSFSNILYNSQPHNPKAILFPDCTYLKVPKSSNFRAQRQSFSSHKRYSLLKAGLIVAPDGFIVDVHGPYFSDTRNNDAAILGNELEDDLQNIRQWIQEGDIFVVDRGYRDVVEFLETLNLNCEIPPFLPRNRQQFTTEEANYARKITKTRWIVESRNGHLKSLYKFFRDAIPMQHCLKLSEYLKIGCALINAYRQPIHMQDESDELAQRMLELVQNPNNPLHDRILRENLQLRRGGGAWVDINENDLQFPILTLEYLRTKTFGTYQVKLSPAYIQDTIGREANHEFLFQVQEFEPGLIRAKIFSRFTQVTKHFLFISYLLPPVRDGDDPIQGTYCTCKVGARTLGMCAHTSSVVWYLGYARNENYVKYPTNVLLGCIQDAANRD